MSPVVGSRAWTSEQDERLRALVVSGNFVDKDDAKAGIRAAIAYLLRGTTGGERGDIVQEIIAIVRQVASRVAARAAQIPWTMTCPAASWRVQTCGGRCCRRR